MEEKFDSFVDLVRGKLDALDAKISDIQHESQGAESGAHRQPIRDILQSSETGHVASSSAQRATGDLIPDIQGEFQCIRDSLSRIRLPPEFKLNETRQGIRRSDQPLFSVLSRCGRYNETLIKLLTTLEPGETLATDTVDQLFTIAHAQCKFLQDEFAALIVNSQFDNSTSRLFRALQRNTSGLNPSSLETLRSAATIAASSRPPSTRGGYTGRGRQRGGFGANRSGDVFHQFTNRQFPRRQWKGDKDNSHTERDDE